ncbi:MAG: right-handed parallel beta-helix repeat-containing protein, partial [Candidatus Thorarchaeota archaeon]
MIIAWLFILASAGMVTSQSNMNCSIYNRTEVPVDMVGLINLYQGNDSHAEYGNLTDYNWTVACKSNITEIDYGCTGNYYNIVQLFNYTNAHVSVDNYYSRQVCYNMSLPYGIEVNISAIGATPADYECAFAIANHSNAHVYDCDNVNATYNVNLQAYIPPYKGCVDLENESTYQDKVVNMTNGYWINADTSLCEDTYTRADPANDGAIIFNATGITLDCNNSIIQGVGTGRGIYILGENSTTVENCYVRQYNIGISLNNAKLGDLDSNTVFNTTGNCFSLETGSNNNTITNTNVSNCSYGFSVSFSNNTYLGGSRVANTSQSGFYAFSATNNTLVNNIIHDTNRGFELSSANGHTVRGNLAYDNTWEGFRFSWSSYSVIEDNVAYDNGGAGISIESNSMYNNVTNCTAYSNGNSGIAAGVSSHNISVSDCIAYDNSFHGISIAVFNSTLDNITAYSNRIYGVNLFNSNNTLVTNSRVYNNTNDFSVNNIFVSGMMMNISNLQFLNPFGLFVNYTNLSIIDSVATSTSYLINWSERTAALPAERISFRNKSINITPTGTVSIDRIVWSWDDGELPGYNEGLFELWMYNSTNGWSMLNNTPSTEYNNISLVDLDPASDYTILLGPQNCPNITSSGTYAQPMDYTGAPNEATEVSGTHKACLKIAASDVVFDCNGRTITYDGSEPGSNTIGILLNSSASNVTLRNCQVSTYNRSYYLHYSDGNTLFNNTAYNSTNSSFHVFQSDNNNLSNNTANGADYGFYIVWDSDGNNLTGNLAYNSTIAGYRIETNSDRNRLLYNRAYDVRYGFYIGGGTGNMILNNTAHQTGLFGFYANSDTNILMVNNTAYNSSRSGFDFFAGSGGDLTNNHAFNNSWYGFEMATVNNYRLVNNTAYNNSQGFVVMTASHMLYENNTVHQCTSSGFNLNWGGNNTIVNNTVFNNSYGITVLDIDNSTIADNLVYNHTERGIYLIQLDFSNITRNSVYNTTKNGFYIDQSTYNNISFNHIESSYVTGMNFTNSDYNNISNNTLQSGPYGVSLDSASTGNLFYFNNFISSSIMHAYAAGAGNFFNTTNGSTCGANCSRGNYWDDTINLDIIDTNSDGFGDSGPEYPYNATNDANVSANVQDEGPLTTKTSLIDLTPPIGTIIIHGYNGTELTGSRNVFLNLTFTDDNCIAACRWANDNPANLDNYLWENCTTIKPWILSPGFGNKTVYYELKDCSDNNYTTNDSIWYNFTQDFTGPTAPVVYDSDYGYDIDWWNDNTTLSAYWWNSTDDISTIHYMYRIMEDGACYNGDCNFTDVGTDTDVTVTGLSLLEGSNYSFQVVAYVDAMLNSSLASSNGTIIDLTKPAAPSVNSTTHPIEGVTYDNGTVKFNFTASDPIGGGTASGIEGYSWLIDRYPGTTPDTNLDDRYWFTIGSPFNSGYSQLLRANSSAGSPHTYAVFSQVKENFSVNETVRVRIAIAELASDYDDLAGISVYMISDSD